MGHHLSIERIVDASPADLYRGWTDPGVVVRWFTPDPWRTVEADIDPRPGGVFRTVMEGPDGERHEGAGCVLEAVADRRFTWTNALGPGFEPNLIGNPGFAFSATMEFVPVEGGTLYRATARHSDAATKQMHVEMGFEPGWNAALDQLLAVIAGTR